MIRGGGRGLAAVKMLRACVCYLPFLSFLSAKHTTLRSSTEQTHVVYLLRHPRYLGTYIRTCTGTETHSSEYTSGDFRMMMMMMSSHCPRYTYTYTYTTLPYFDCARASPRPSLKQLGRRRKWKERELTLDAHVFCLPIRRYRSVGQTQPATSGLLVPFFLFPPLLQGLPHGLLY